MKTASPLVKGLLESERKTPSEQTFSAEEQIKLMRGMLLTRALDNALKALFLSGEMRYKDKGFHGKGFRSLGQEAIYGATFLLNIGRAFQKNGEYKGDVAAPLIRDLGVFLCMSGGDCERVINAQAGKEGPPCHGRDLHVGDLSLGIITPAAPLAIATCNALGMAMAFKLKNEARVALSFIGDGGSSLGEWHEAINFAAVHQLPMIFCIENNQTALSTPVQEQSRALCFADKALGYGVLALIVDGNEVEAVSRTFKLAADHARSGQGPVLIELITMRMCGHAHHDDMLYLGYDAKLDVHLPPAKASGYANEAQYERWRARDPIAIYEQKLIKANILHEQQKLALWEEVKQEAERALTHVKARSWPQALGQDDELVLSDPYPLWPAKNAASFHYSFNKAGKTYLQAIADSVAECFKKYPNSVVIGEDVAPPYGNPFMLFKSIMDEFPDRFINTPISEGAIVGACVGMAMEGMRPIGEMQFNDFVACAMNQVVNNAAKSFYRLGVKVPMVLRMPYGGLRRAGPYHSQDTSAWFFRVAGLKIMAPSTPIDCYYLLQKAVSDNDPVLFYEHIALYRDPKIKQIITASSDTEGAAIARLGNSITFITYGAYVHIACEIAKQLEEKHQVSVEVIDLRYLKPIDFATCYDSIKKTSRVLLFGEDSLMGSILQSIASEIGQHCFSYLDAPVCVLGSRNTPVPYAPSLEDDYLLSGDRIFAEAIKLINY